MNPSPTPGPENELELRSLLRGAVEGLEPSDGALARLQVAVPRRRQRKRQALVGVAAAALLVGTAIPAFFRVATSPDSANPAIAGHGEKAPDGSTGGGSTNPDLTGPDVFGPSAFASPSGKPGKGKGGKNGRDGKDRGKGGTPKGEPAGSGIGKGGPNPPADDSGKAPVCQADQLGVAVQDTRTPDADGKVYGTFRITNVSQSDCVVGSGGSVSALAADQRQVTVLDHTSGDPATGLPDPSAEQRALRLEPNAAYEVQFAWVPAQSCPDPTSVPDPSPDPTASDGETDPDPLDGGEPPVDESENPVPSQAGAVSVTHVADPGAPVATTTIPNACEGTIYRTGVLAAPPTP
ncbi:hypothetical protein [Streptomyces sp. NPDC086023]|uniref:hypothetical protein n=1 Tax=Streptomyces sp. NPDC086023 TaxID=3365746 RepID=UPI0037CD2D33